MPSNGFNNDQPYKTPEEMRTAAKSLFLLARKHIHEARYEEELGEMSQYTAEQIAAKRKLATLLLERAQDLLEKARSSNGGNGKDSGFQLN
jgi:F0F1-type ATP synthase delta subunit